MADLSDIVILNLTRVVDQSTKEMWIRLLGNYACLSDEALTHELLALTSPDNHDEHPEEQRALLSLFIKSKRNITCFVHSLGERFLLEIEIKIAQK